MNIDDIAKLIGVSNATVSRAINNSGYVKEETRRKIFEVIEKHQYVPNAVARSLSTRDTLSIGVIIPDIENEFFSSIISGISEVAEQNHYNIHFLGSNETLGIEHAFLDTVQGQRLSGVIITPISEVDPITKARLIHLEKSGIPVVLVDRDIDDAIFEGVFVDNIAGAYDGVNELIKAGHRKIAIIKGPETSKPGKERLIGYKKALEEANIDLSCEYMVPGNFKIMHSYKGTEVLLNLSDPPTAIFACSNMTTLGCLKYLTEKKIKLGKDISLIGFDDIEILKLIDYKISVIDRDAKQQGREAMRLMLERLKNKGEKKHTRFNVPYQVILRGSERLDR
ncbi:MAG: LacI family transcriptional regulator [Clostridia bacterium]|jgi:LacI family transcriptional regulator|nr:LacI family transcriptional regulator [Clostridia bacterium]